MRAHWQYLKYLLRHKWFVLLEGLKLGVPLWLGLVHDWSKFLPSEWLPYVRHFYSETYSGLSEVLRCSPAYRRLHEEECKADFDLAWLRHQHRNKHHWQFWILAEDEPDRAIEVQAALEHEQWACWATRMLYRSPKANVRRWRQLVDLSYEDLTDVERELYRRWATESLGAGLVCLPMPDRYRREMVADWRGAGRAVGKPDTAAWYIEHRAYIHLHSSTREWVERELGVSNKDIG